MEELFDSLKNWGCDVDGALARFIGDRELYRSCLHTAAGDQNFELLPEALRAQGRWGVHLNVRIH